MHRPGIVGDSDLSTSNKRRQICRRCLAGEIARPGRGGSDLLASLLIAPGARQGDGKSILKKLPRNTSESFNCPMLGLPNRARHQDDKRFRRRYAVLLQQSIYPVGCLRRQVNSEVGRLIIEAKQWRHPQVAIDRVNIERRNGDAVGVSDPRTFARAAPAMVGDVLEIMFSGDRQTALDGPIKSNAHARAADESKKSRTRLAMHVDDQLVSRM